MTNQGPKAHIMVGTPTKGNVHAHYTSSLLQLQVECMRQGMQMSASFATNRTCPEARSECVRNALDTTTDPNCQFPVTHLLFVDGDIGFEAKSVIEMVALDVPVVGAIYAGQGSNETSKIQLIFMPIAGHEKDQPDERGCIKVNGLGLGLTLIKIEALAAMEEHYCTELGHKDAYGGRTLVNLFLETIENGKLYGEDYNFFRRWRELDDKNEVLAYLPVKITHNIGNPITVNAAELFQRLEVVDV